MSTEAKTTSQRMSPQWNVRDTSRSIDTAVSHACLSNLVIYTEDMSHEAAIFETMQDYIVKHPCRVILILAKPRNGESKLEAKVAVHTYSSGSKSIPTFR